MGLAQVPGPIAAGPTKAGKLVHVLKPFASTTPGVFLYYPNRHQMMPKLRAFIDHVRAARTAPTKSELTLMTSEPNGAEESDASR